MSKKFYSKLFIKIFTFFWPNRTLKALSTAHLNGQF
jgi:hypothetical protein